MGVAAVGIIELEKSNTVTLVGAAIDCQRSSGTDVFVKDDNRSLQSLF